jgi:hypothetical protein
MKDKKPGKTPSPESVPDKKAPRSGSRKSGRKTSPDPNTGSIRTDSTAGRRTGRRGDALDDSDELVPIDDAVDFDLIRRQQRLKAKTHTRRQMEKVWDQIQASLRTDASRMKWTDNR